MKHKEKARELFLKGCNCSQAVLCAFGDVTGLEESTALRLSSSFGGGMGRLREVCGALTGAFMVAGLLYGYEDLEDKELKAEHYERIQELARRFEAENGSIICRELLGLNETHSRPVPADRTESYYKERPCLAIVESAAEILDEYMAEHPISQGPKVS